MLFLDPLENLLLGNLLSQLFHPDEHLDIYAFQGEKIEGGPFLHMTGDLGGGAGDDDLLFTDRARNEADTSPVLPRPDDAPLADLAMALLVFVHRHLGSRLIENEPSPLKVKEISTTNLFIVSALLTRFLKGWDARGSDGIPTYSTSPESVGFTWHADPTALVAKSKGRRMERRIGPPSWNRVVCHEFESFFNRSGGSEEPRRC